MKFIHPWGKSETMRIVLSSSFEVTKKKKGNRDVVRREGGGDKKDEVENYVWRMHY